MPRTLALTLIEYSGRTGLTVKLFAESDATNAVANGSGDTLTSGDNGAFTADIAEVLSGRHRAIVYDGTLAIAEGRAYFDGTTGTVIVDSASQMYAALLAAFKADAQLGTATGGMVANVLAIKPKTDLIGSGTAFTAVPVSELGQLDKIIIGDDYLKANSRSFKWTFDAIPGFTIGTCTGVFGVKASSNPALSFTSTATTTDITDLGGGRWQVEFEVAKTLTSALPQGTYDWSVEIVQAGTEITVAKSKDRQSPVRLMVKQT